LFGAADIFSAVPGSLFTSVILLGFWRLYMGSEMHVGDLRVRTACVHDNMGPGVVMSEQPQIDFLYSGDRTVAYDGLASTDDLAQHLMSQHVDYVLIAPELRWADSMYQPSLSAQAQRVLELMPQLPPSVSVRLVYSDEPSFVSLYRVSSTRRELARTGP
jgi:hypothetical protein